MTKEFNFKERLKKIKYPINDALLPRIEVELLFDKFVQRLKEEDNDFEEDIIALIEINNYGKEDLIAKMRRLCKAHKEEKDRLAGDLK